MSRTERCLGIVLFQLGGPDTLDAIQPFLFNLFCDPDIIDFPFARIGRRPLARLISATRAKKVQHHYSVIGGGSPIRKFTETQAKALEARLESLGINARCFVAMRYWHPFITEAIEQVRAANCDEIVLLPLYPHYSSTTTGSSLNEWNRNFCDDIPVRRVESFYRDELYLASLVKGDPYQRQIEETVRLLMHHGRWPNHHRLCYQSKVGASKWLQPSLHRTLRDLAAEKVRDVCVVPVSFVSDHVETLGEIDHEAREEAHRLGIRQFEMTEGLNDSPKFINGLAHLVLRALDEPVDTVIPNQESVAAPLMAAD